MKDRADTDLTMTPRDQRLIETMRESYAPAAMDPSRQAAFRRRLAARLERRARLPWRAAFAVTASAAAAAALWLTILPGGQPRQTQLTTAQQAEAPLLYAFVDPVDYGDNGVQPADFLPNDYVALANALDVPVDRR